MKSISRWLGAIAYTFSVAAAAFVLLILALEMIEGHIETTRQPVIPPYQSYCNRFPELCLEPRI